MPNLGLPALVGPFLLLLIAPTLSSIGARPANERTTTPYHLAAAESTLPAHGGSGGKASAIDCQMLGKDYVMVGIKARVLLTRSRARRRMTCGMATRPATQPQFTPDATAGIPPISSRRPRLRNRAG